MGLNEFIQVGTRIKTLRKSKGISQKEFATLVGIKYPTYSNYENNNRVPSKTDLEKIAEKLDVSVNELLGIKYFDLVSDLDKIKNELSDLELFEKIFISHFGQESYDSFQEYSVLTDEAAKRVREYIKDLCANPQNRIDISD